MRCEADGWFTGLIEWFLGHKLPDILNDNINKMTEEIAAEINRAFFIPQTVPLVNTKKPTPIYPDGYIVSFTYGVTTLQISDPPTEEGMQALVAGQAKLYPQPAGKGPGITYRAPRQDATVVPPLHATVPWPLLYSQSPLEVLLAGARPSSAMMTAALNLVIDSGELMNYNFSLTLMQTNLSVYATWGASLFGRERGAPRDALVLETKSGDLLGDCDMQPPPSITPSSRLKGLLHVHFTYVRAYSRAVQYTNASGTWMYLQLDRFTFNDTNITLVKPARVGGQAVPGIDEADAQRILEEGASQHLLPMVNAYMQSNPVSVPKSMRSLAPNPVLEFHDTPEAAQCASCTKLPPEDVIPSDFYAQVTEACDCDQQGSSRWAQCVGSPDLCSSGEGGDGARLSSSAGSSGKDGRVLGEAPSYAELDSRHGLVDDSSPDGGMMATATTTPPSPPWPPFPPHHGAFPPRPPPSPPSPPPPPPPSPPSSPPSPSPMPPPSPPSPPPPPRPPPPPSPPSPPSAPPAPPFSPPPSSPPPSPPPPPPPSHPPPSPPFLPPPLPPPDAESVFVHHYLAICVVVTSLVVLASCYYFRRPLSSCLSLALAELARMLRAGFLSWVATWRLAYIRSGLAATHERARAWADVHMGRPQTLTEMHTWHTAIIGVVCFATTLEAGAWLLLRPFDSFKGEAGRESIGLSRKRFDGSIADRAFDDWQAAGFSFNLAAALINVVLLVLPFCLRRAGRTTHLLRLCGLALIPLGSFLGFVLPQLLLSLRHAIALRPDGSSFLQGDPALRSDISSIASFGLMGVLFSFSSYLQLFHYLAMPLGSYLGMLLFLTIRVHNGCTPSLAAADAFANSALLVLLLSTSEVVATLFSVINVYQTLALPVWWLFSWVIIWLAPLPLIYHLECLGQQTLAAGHSPTSTSDARHHTHKTASSKATTGGTRLLVLHYMAVAILWIPGVTFAVVVGPMGHPELFTSDAVAFALTTFASSLLTTTAFIFLLLRGHDTSYSGSWFTCSQLPRWLTWRSRLSPTRSSMEDPFLDNTVNSNRTVDQTRQDAARDASEGDTSLHSRAACEEQAPASDSVEVDAQRVQGSGVSYVLLWRVWRWWLWVVNATLRLLVLIVVGIDVAKGSVARSPPPERGEGAASESEAAAAPTSSATYEQGHPAFAMPASAAAEAAVPQTLVAELDNSELATTDGGDEDQRVIDDSEETGDNEEESEATVVPVSSEPSEQGHSPSHETPSPEMLGSLVGQRVKLQDLVGRNELNDAVGVCEGFDGECYTVRNHLGEKLRLKPANLVAVPASPPGSLVGQRVVIRDLVRCIDLNGSKGKCIDFSSDRYTVIGPGGGQLRLKPVNVVAEPTPPLGSLVGQVLVTRDLVGRSKLNGIVGLCAEFDGERYTLMDPRSGAQLRVRPANVVPFIHASLPLRCVRAMRAGCKGWLAWIKESFEREDPDTYGFRVEKRRFGLVLGVSALTVAVFFAVDEAAHLPPSSVRFTQLLALAGVDFQWPPGNATVFDDAFHAYDDATGVSTLLLITSLLLMATALAIDCTARLQKFHIPFEVGQLVLFCGAAVLVLSCFAPAVPNYMAKTPIDCLVPDCAPVFYRTIVLLSRNALGVFITIVMMADTYVLLLLLPALLVRVSFTLMVIDQRVKRDKVLDHSCHRFGTFWCFRPPCSRHASLAHTRVLARIATAAAVRTHTSPVRRMHGWRLTLLHGPPLCCAASSRWRHAHPNHDALWLGSDGCPWSRDGHQRGG